MNDVLYSPPDCREFFADVGEIICTSVSEAYNQQIDITDEMQWK